MNTSYTSRFIFFAFLCIVMLMLLNDRGDQVSTIPVHFVFVTDNIQQQPENQSKTWHCIFLIIVIDNKQTSHQGV